MFSSSASEKLEDSIRARTWSAKPRVAVMLSRSPSRSSSAAVSYGTTRWSCSRIRSVIWSSASTLVSVDATSRNVSAMPRRDCSLWNKRALSSACPHWRLLMKHSQPHPRVLADLVKAGRGVAVPEEGGPAAQEPVQVLYDPLRRTAAAGTGGYFPDPVAGMLHRLVRRPAGKEWTRLSRWSLSSAPGGGGSRESPRPHPLPPDARSGSSPPSAPARDRPAGPQPLQRPLGLLTGPAHHDRVVGITHQNPIPSSHARSSRCR